MNLFTGLYVAALFVALTPGVLLTLPKGGAKLTVAAVHGVVFAIVLTLVNKYVTRLRLEGFKVTGNYSQKLYALQMKRIEETCAAGCGYKVKEGFKGTGQGARAAGVRAGEFCDCMTPCMQANPETPNWRCNPGEYTRVVNLPNAGGKFA